MFGGSSSVGRFRIPPQGGGILNFAVKLAALRLLTSAKFGQVAQSVEQRPEKPCVASSILALSTRGGA
jgi:hypothetical protein